MARYQPYCAGCEYSNSQVDEFPFYLPDWKGRNKSKTPRPRFRKYFPLDPRKHPVSILQEYCSIQSIQPYYEFYEIPQKVGIEYGCVVTVENFIGEGRAFSKKTAKHQAAANVLRKLSEPNYFGDDELGPRRFVSETGIVSVHYENTPKRRSCFKNRPRMTPPPRLLQAKRVKWLDSSDGETEDESHKGSFEELSEKGTELAKDSEDEVSTKKEDKFKESSFDAYEKKSDDEEVPEREGRFKTSIQSNQDKNKKEIDSTPNEDDDLMDEISEYLSERLRRTSIDRTNENKAESSSDEIKVIELNDVKPKKRKKKRVGVMNVMDGTQTLGRKSCLKEVNPIGYLQEACTYFNCSPPSYNMYKEGTNYFRATCTLFDTTTQEFGETPKEAKRMAAVSMIHQLGW